MRTTLLIFILAIACSASFFTRVDHDAGSSCICDVDYLKFQEAKAEWRKAQKVADSLETVKDSIAQIIYKKLGW